MPPPKPPLPTAKNLPFQSSGRKSPKPYVVLPMDWTCTETAHRAGRPTGLVGYPVWPWGTWNVAFALSGYAKLTDALEGSEACIAAGVHSRAVAAPRSAPYPKIVSQRIAIHVQAWSREEVRCATAHRQSSRRHPLKNWNPGTPSPLPPLLGPRDCGNLTRIGAMCEGSTLDWAIPIVELTF